MLDDLRSQFGNSMRRLLQRPIGVAHRTPVASASQPGLRSQARDDQRKRVRLMKRDLYHLLEQHPAVRQLMRHLDLVERALRHGGLDALEALPVRVVAKALAEMERLVWDWSPVGLAELRSRMAVMAKNPVRTAPPPSSAPRPSAVLDALDRAAATQAVEVIDVTDVDHSIFEEMERSWTGRVAAT